jgi:hypothetical protein
MKFESILRATLVACSVCGVSASSAAPMTQDEYRVTKDRIEAEYRDSKEACDRFSANAKDVCREEAKGRQQVARAELEYNRSGKPKDATKLARIKADSAYAVARERCDDRSGQDKELCLKEAKTAHTKALVDAKADEKVGEARRDAAAEKRDAEFNLAKEKCETLAGDNKSACLADARARYGKS